jgi:DNA-binding NarL/FixJ family response regulator
MPGSSIEPIRIILLDVQTLFRAGLRLILDSQPGMEVVGEADSVSESLEIVNALKPDIILLDLNLRCLPDVEIVSSLINASSGARLILVTDTDNEHALQRAVEDGVVGVISKTQSPDTLIKAIEKVHAGEVWLERSMIATVLTRLSRGQSATKPDSENESFDHLSEREKEVVTLIGQGYKNKKISQELCISETTVRHHLTSIYSKLGVTDRLELLVYAHRHGLVTAFKK